MGSEGLWFGWSLLGCFDCNSRFFCALECTPDVVVLRAAVECEHLGTMRALHLKAIANPLDPLCKCLGALRAFDFELIVDHGCLCPDMNKTVCNTFASVNARGRGLRRNASG